jgi:hypothetical protein
MEYIISETDIHKIIFRLQKEGWCPPEAWINQKLRSRPAPAPSKGGCDGCPKDSDSTIQCPMPGHCDQMKCPLCCEGSDFPTLPEEIKKYEEAAAAKAREDVLSQANDLLDYLRHANNPSEMETAVYVHDVRGMLQSLRTEAHK